MQRPFTIGVISDTHGLLRPEALAALAGSDLILHAGDVGAPEILQRLSEIAVVHAVRGNVDTEPWAKKLPGKLTVDGGGRRMTILHRLQDLRAVERGVSIVVFGHSHEPGFEEKDSVLYFNPGSAGPRRFRLPVTCGRILLKDGSAHPEIVQLLR